MRKIVFSGIAALVLASPARAQHLNPLVDLLAQKKPVFGVYAPSNGRNAETQKTPAQLVQEALGYKQTDFLFDGTMEGDFDRAFPPFTEFMKSMKEAGTLEKASTPRLHHPMMVKTHEIAENPSLAAERIAKQLNNGVSGIVFVGVESAEEVKAGIAAMRFKSNGGTRPDDIGHAAEVWGLSGKEYREKADLWPLNPKGELVNWTIVESKEGLAKIREIAAVKGIGVLFPGAGTLRRVFSTTDASGQRTFDQQGWENAIQQVLAACKEFNVACGYPATPADIEMRMQQGFSVFIMNWGEQGFKAVEIGRKAAGR
jgi:4-hydroxy-2-oxoheptanedioate aldolase